MECIQGCYKATTLHRHHQSSKTKLGNAIDSVQYHGFFFYCIETIEQKMGRRIAGRQWNSYWQVGAGQDRSFLMDCQPLNEKSHDEESHFTVEWVSAAMKAAPEGWDKEEIVYGLSTINSFLTRVPVSEWRSKATRSGSLLQAVVTNNTDLERLTFLGKRASLVPLIIAMAAASDLGKWGGASSA